MPEPSFAVTVKQEEEEKPSAKEQGAMEGVEFSQLGVGEFCAAGDVGIPDIPEHAEVWGMRWAGNLGKSFIVGKMEVLGG